MSGNGTYVRRRYSRAFQLKVVSEVESGKYTISQARRIYDIGSCGTIYLWLRKFGKGHLIEKVVRVEMKDEKDKLKELEIKNRKLESALADAHLKLICWESLIECVEEYYQIDVKKNFGSKLSNERLSKPKKKR